MPDFEAPVVSGTAADTAVAYIIKRVKRDADFRHYMIGTEALRLCLVAQGKRLGLDPLCVASICSLLDAPPAEGDGHETPCIVRYRKRLEEIDQIVFDAHQRGRLQQDDFDAIRNLSIL